MDAIVDATDEGDPQGLLVALGDFPQGLNRSRELGRLLEVTLDYYYDQNYLSCFEILLDNGAGLDLEYSGSGETFLHLVTNYGVEAMPFLEAIAVRGCEPYLEIPDYEGDTPFQAACGKGQFQIAKRLQQLGAYVRNRNNDMDTALHSACAGGNVEIVELILNNGGGVDLEAQNTHGERPLHFATCNNNPQCVELLVDRGAQINVVDNRGYSPILHACGGGTSVDMLNFLLGRGANPNTVDNDTGHTPLHLACMIFYGGTPHVQALINQGADVNATDNMGRTPLYPICKFGNLEGLNALLAAGADASMDDNNGNTLLHYAAESTITNVDVQREIIDVLIENGVNPRIRNSSGLRPDDVAVLPEIAHQLRAYAW